MTVQEGGRKKSRSATWKIVAIGFLALVLQIPSGMISNLMRERQSRRDEVIQEINGKWGGRQTIAGPFFTIPFKSYYKDPDSNVKFDLKYFHILPEELNISGQLSHQVRRRGIYEAVLYNAKLALSGSFSIPSLAQLNIPMDDILWDKAVFSISISDLRGLQENINLTFGGSSSHEITPGLKTADIASAGVSSGIPLSPGSGGTLPFSFQLNLNGSEQIQFVPLAKETSVSVKSPWPSPSFNGAFLPVTREVDAQGFSATWKVLHLNRNYPQVWQGDQHKVCDSAFGLSLMITADLYQKSARIAKYAMMFIVFTFAAFFLSEISSGRPVHPIQYLLIGLAVVLFYVLLLSISEHLNFDFAYLIAAAAVTVLISSYSHGILRSKGFTMTISAVLSILYAYLYIVLQLEDYALLMGATGLFAVLAVIMHLTRSVDWYGTDSDGERPGA